MIKTFQDLDVWQQGHKFVLKIYTLTKKFPTAERFGLVSQLQRAAVSITCNIAEGFSRYYFKDRVRFYYQARGSLSEAQNLVLIAQDVNYISAKTAQELLVESHRVNNILNGLIKKTCEINKK